MQLLTLTGPSCSGKTTLLNNLVENHGYKSIVSHTTRTPRKGEIDGVDYHFVQKSRFQEMKEVGDFMEDISFNGEFYGVSNKEALKATTSGDRAVLIVDPHGLEQIQKYYKDSDTQIYSMYINGSPMSLIYRYLIRASNEDFSNQTIARKHAIRLESLFKEQTEWHPFKNPLIAYDYFAMEMGPENIEETIEYINKEAFK